MEETPIVLSIPDDLVDEIEIFEVCFKEAVTRSGVADDREVSIIRPPGRNLSGGDLNSVLLCLGAGALTWFTVKWADTYLWPEIQHRIDRISKKVVRRLVAQIERLRRERT